MTKKRIFGIIGAAAIAVAVTFNVSIGMSNSFLPDLNLANIMALARGESVQFCSEGQKNWGTCDYVAFLTYDCIFYNNDGGDCNGTWIKDL